MKARFVLSIVVALLIALPLAAEPIGRMTVSASGVDWQATGSFDRLVLVVAAPNGTTITREFQGGHATFRLADLAPRIAPEGTYVYELRALPKISDEVKARLAAARAKNDDDAIAKVKAEAGIGEPVIQGGAFTILNGSFVTDRTETPGPGKTPKSTATSAVSGAPGKLTPGTNDVVTADDAIIQGSLCAGLDCVNNESFGFDTIRLKENNTRIKFDDTSTSAGFPANDWQLTANDSASGGSSKFSIEDITGAKVPFTITAGAPTNSLFVGSTGKVGVGTSSPVLNVHISTSDTPAIRQEQNNSGGFTAQTWDIGANEANWFVRDVTSGSRLPLRIRPGAPTSAVDIAADGKVGIGTGSPGAKLDIGQGSTARGGFTKLLIGNGGDTAQMEFYGTSKSAAISYNGTVMSFFTNGTPFVQAVNIDNSGNVGLGVVAPTNPLQHSSGAFLSAGGTWTNASSRDYKQDIADLSNAEAVCALEDLKPVKYAYKVDPNERHVGFIAEDVPDLVATKDRKSLSPMDIVAVLTKVVQQQQSTIDELKARLDQIEKKQ
jgi:Chaperone of endosialidase